MWSTRRQSPTVFPSFPSPASASARNNNDNNASNSGILSHCTRERGVLHKNVHGQPVRIYSQTASNLHFLQTHEFSLNRYQCFENSPNSRYFEFDGDYQELLQSPCYFDSNCITYAMLRAKADGITIDMLSNVFALFSEDLSELNWMTFEKDVHAMKNEVDSPEILKLLNNEVLKAQVQDFSLRSCVRKADLVEAWPSLCKFGLLQGDSDLEDEVELVVKQQDVMDEAGLLVEKVAASAALMCDKLNDRCEDESISCCPESEKPNCPSPVSPKKASCDEDDDLSKGSSSKALIVSSGKKTSNAEMSKFSVASSQRLMLLIMFLMVIYRGLNVLLQQRKVKSLKSNSQFTAIN